MNALSELAMKYGTDKGPGVHNYTPIYNRLMQHRKEAPITLLEIGLWHGASARMWADYFPLGVIYMVENNRELVREWKADKSNPQNVRIIEATAIDTGLWKQVIGRLDFVIDDGSHYGEDQISAMMEGFQYLKAGGLWCIENTHTSFNVQYGPQILYPWVNGRMIEQQMGGCGFGSFYTARDMAEETLSDLGKMIFGIQSYKSLLVFERAEDQL